jgi:hypothetical protein
MRDFWDTVDTSEDSMRYEMDWDIHHNEHIYSVRDPSC